MSERILLWLKEQPSLKRKRPQSIIAERYIPFKRQRTSASDPGPSKQRVEEMAQQHMLTSSHSGTFALPGLPASASAGSQTAPSSSTSSRKRRASGQPAAFVISDYQKLAYNNVRLVADNHIPEHVQQLRTKTSGHDMSVQCEVKVFREKMEKWIESVTSGNEALFTGVIGPELFPEKPGLSMNTQTDFTTEAMPKESDSALFSMFIKNPRPDYLYGYKQSVKEGLRAVLNARRLTGVQFLETSPGVLCGSFPVELKCQAKGGNAYDALAQLAGALAACLNTFHILAENLTDVGIPCDDLQHLALPGMIMDEFTAHEVVAWADGPEQIKVALVATYGVRTQEGVERLLKRLNGIFHWLQNEQRRTVESIIQALAGASEAISRFKPPALVNSGSYVDAS